MLIVDGMKQLYTLMTLQRTIICIVIMFVVTLPVFMSCDDDNGHGNGIGTPTDDDDDDDNDNGISCPDLTGRWKFMIVPVTNDYGSIFVITEQTENTFKGYGWFEWVDGEDFTLEGSIGNVYSETRCALKLSLTGTTMGFQSVDYQLYGCYYDDNTIMCEGAFLFLLNGNWLDHSAYLDAVRE